MKKQDAKENIVSRPPIIAIMGHIDHGKSKLLDYIRKTNVVDSEAGGITQHLSAYEVTHKNQSGEDKKITFLDTPGHAAFSAMRSRGVVVADIAILVVSAEEGVKAQTIEALETIKESGIPYIVAINKIDRPEANVEKTKQNLSENKIYLEGYGGDIPFVPISAKEGTGVDELLDMMLLVAEMEELTGDLNKKATGVVVESRLDSKEGICATLIIKDGTMTKGGFITVQGGMAPTRKIEDFLGNNVPQTSFSSPVRIVGFNQIPPVGSIFNFSETKKEAEALIKEYKNSSSSKENNIMGDENLEATVIPIIIKADVLGTLEAIENLILQLNKEDIYFKIISSGAGSISEADIKMAGAAKKPIIIGFHTKVEPSAIDLADRSGMEIKIFDIIYKITEWLEEEMEKRRPLISTEEITGRAKVIRVFSKTKDKQVLGAKVKEGSLKLKSGVKIIRRDVELGTGKILELQQSKIAAQEIQEGNEFGSMIESKVEIAPGDIIEAFIIVEK